MHLSRLAILPLPLRHLGRAYRRRHDEKAVLLVPRTTSERGASPKCIANGNSGSLHPNRFFQLTAERYSHDLKGVELRLKDYDSNVFGVPAFQPSPSGIDPLPLQLRRCRDFSLPQRLKCFEATLATNNLIGLGTGGGRSDGNGTPETQRRYVLHKPGKHLFITRPRVEHPNIFKRNEPNGGLFRNMHRGSSEGLNRRRATLLQSLRQDSSERIFKVSNR